MIMKDDVSLDIGARIEVYYNLHKGGFSVKALSGEHKGKVVAYTDQITITNASFHVNEKTLKRILDKKVRAVYAVVRGYYLDDKEKLVDHMQLAYINPYTSPLFPAVHSPLVHFKENVCYYEEDLFNV